MLMDPLILAGDPVVPLVLGALPNRQMPHRRYAIAFLGNGAFNVALPALRRLLADETEEAWIRSDALRAICDIDASEGVRRARTLNERDDQLGWTAKLVLERGCETRRRSYADAWWGRHD
jgi:hypothetical protein